MDILLRDYSRSDAIRGPFPTARVGCAISYDIDFSRYRSGLVPSDMPAAQNGMSTMFGGSFQPYREGGKGFQHASFGRYSAHSASNTTNVTFSDLPSL